MHATDQVVSQLQTTLAWLKSGLLDKRKRAALLQQVHNEQIQYQSKTRSRWVSSLSVGLCFIIY